MNKIYLGSVPKTSILMDEIDGVCGCDGLWEIVMNLQEEGVIF